MKNLAVGCLLALVAGLLPAAASVWPRTGEPVAVIALPFSPGASAIIADAGGTLLDSMTGDRIAVGRWEAGGFLARLYRGGAALVVDAVATGCYKVKTPAQRTI